MSTSVTLYELADEFLSMSDRLQDADLPEQAVADTLEAMQYPVEEKARAVAVVVMNMQAEHDMVDAAVNRLSDRQARIRKRMNWLKDYLKLNMQRTGITKIEHPLMSISLKKNPAKVIIDDEMKVPNEYWATKPPPPPEISKSSIAVAIKAGVNVPGAYMTQDERVEIKV